MAREKRAVLVGGPYDDWGFPVTGEPPKWFEVSGHLYRQGNTPGTYVWDRTASPAEIQHRREQETTP